ncbi:MAG: O-antigen ligase family protein [Patescibacteria group bacterium]|nr:O-antigen ligase family protein [Patescibacteria group bacterium]
MFQHKIQNIALLGWVFLGIGLILGQVVEVPIPIIGSLSFLDFVILFLGSWGLVVAVNYKKKLPLFVWFAILFIVVAILSLVGSLQHLDWVIVIKSSQFLVRWVLYAGLVFWVFDTTKYLRVTFIKNGSNVLVASIIALVILGFVQLVFFPDFGLLEKFGWDPHQNRLASTFLDPNLLGVALILGLAIILGRWREKKSYSWIVWGALVLLAILFTYSRSALVGLAVLVLGFGIKEWRILILILLVFLGVYSFSPRLQSRITGALNLDVTARYRIESLQHGFEILKDNPFLGVGYNTIQYSRERYYYQPISNSSTGFDSSLMTVAVTTGWPGLVAYLGIIFSAIWLAFKRFRQSLYKDGLGFAVSFGTVAVLASSFFVNSFLYAPVMAIWWVTVGLMWKDYEDGLV